MKAIVTFQKKTFTAWSQVSVILLTGILSLIFTSCQKDENNLFTQESIKEQNVGLTAEMCRNYPGGKKLTIYYGHKIFKRGYGTPFVQTETLENLSFNCFDGNFVLIIQNGRDRRTRVSSAEIKIDGVIIAGPSDFAKNKYLIIKPISGLTPESILEVKLNGAPGSFIDLWIEGKINFFTPSFDQIGPLCQNSTAPTLPLSSTNIPNIPGTWNPATINTTLAGKTTYTFTPAEGQCATTVIMEIEVTSSIIPEFPPIGSLLQNSIAPGLPATSNNNIVGTWSPEAINTANQGTFIYTFTPAEGQCASTYTISVKIGGVADLEDNIYYTVKIGNQWWMAENLETSIYNNGDLIGTTIPATFDISGESTPKYQWSYDGNESNADAFGRLYTWYAVTDNRGVCPTGWHIPSDAEWTSLSDYLVNNGYGYEGSGSDIAKSLSSVSGWETDAIPGNIGNNQASNNSSGFTALPGGIRAFPSTFTYIGNFTGWWSSTESNNTDAWFRRLLSYSNNMSRYGAQKKHGASARCVKD